MPLRARTTSAWFTLALAALVAGGCSATPLMSDEEMRELDEHTGIFAAAARAFEEARDRWPADEQELLSVMRKRPAGTHLHLTFHAFDATPDELAIGYRAAPIGSAAAPDADRPELVGTLRVRPVRAADLPAAIVEWSDGRGPPFGRDGALIKGDCALGDYALPADGPTDGPDGPTD